MARWNYLFENGSKEDVASVLKTYQNDDGGFANALEPDCWNINSTPLQTWVATQIIKEINLDVMMAKRKISLNELSDKVGITNANLSILKTGKAKAVRFSTLEKICEVLECQPGDILQYVDDER